jgi:hypothetical protein
LPGHQLIRDCYGRLHRVGESERDLLGRFGRRRILWSAWGAMLGAGALQYGFALTALPLRGTRATLAVLAVWTVCQAAAVPLAHRLRAAGRAEPGALVLLGGACCAGALAIAATVAEAAHPAGGTGLLVGYGVLGGTGAGLVYASCAATAARWYPERAPSAVAFVTGGYAYGAVLPLLLLLALGRRASAVAPLLGVLGGLALLAALVCGAVLRDPPEHWWPAGIDPRPWTGTSTAACGTTARRCGRPEPDPAPAAAPGGCCTRPPR